jgi:SAM-dependent methyltransferase
MSVADAEFDHLAETYYDEHKENIRVTGEDPEYFAEYKIADLARALAARHATSHRITDFGCGIGNSIPFFRKHFPNARLSCADVSSQSLKKAQERFPGDQAFLLIEGSRIPLETASQDVVFSACVFHHIAHEEHGEWLRELLRITRPGGVLAIYEHNPLNPLTVRAVNTCPLDRNARLIKAGQFRRACLAAGWSSPQIAYRVYFPHLLASLRPLERGLGWLCLGAQYRLLARR